MKLFLDTEFNGHGGHLISMALAAEDGKHWYGVWTAATSHPWVAQHVLPMLGKMPLTIDGTVDGTAAVRASLHHYLMTRSGAIIYADWPGDFRHLMAAMEGDSYEQSWIVECNLRLLAESDPRPEFPHNALSDAIALMHWHAARG